MHLIFINEIGLDYKGQKQYEFIFSTKTELNNENWFIIPASLITGQKSPDIEYIDSVGLLKNTDLDLELIQNSDYFGVIDAIDGVVSLGWEKFNYDSEIERLYFKFGERFETVTKKLKSRNYKLVIEELNNV
jgi:hypothetical protein